jgi:hypothetical protein
MNRVGTLFTLALGLSVGIAFGQDAPVVPPLKGESKTIQLFNGKNLDGWVGFDEYWSVQDGVIVGKNTKPIKHSTYLLTKEKFTDFRLIFSSKLVTSEMHSGVAFWGTVPPDKFKGNAEAERAQHTYQGHLVMFPSGWGMYDLFRREGKLGVDNGPGKKVNKQHDWNDIEILAQGNRVRVAANGAAIVDWRDPRPDYITAGPIGLQLHSNTVPQEVQFKGLKLETFPKDDRLITVK